MTTYTTRAAAQECGVSHQTIAKHAHRLEIPVEGGAFRITEDDIERLKESIREARTGRPVKVAEEAEG